MHHFQLLVAPVALIHILSLSLHFSLHSGLIVWHMIIYGCGGHSSQGMHHFPAWAEGTTETYGSGLLLFHVFCDMKKISESQRAPASSVLITSFLATLAAWRLLHGIFWEISDSETQLMLKGASTAAPSSSKCPPHEPYTIALLLSICSQLDLTSAFYGCSNVHLVTDRNGLVSTTFFLPKSIFWASQDALFAYKFKSTFRVLTKTAILSRLAQAARTAHCQPLSGHSICIGGTLEYLLRGVPFEVVKSKSRWASDTFLLYLRRHAQIMTSYMQAVPAVHEQFIRYAMPPVH
ncbi:hypothetical protein BKA93DRAFT_819320 [Sparassis latifolia]